MRVELSHVPFLNLSKRPISGLGMCQIFVWNNNICPDNADCIWGNTYFIDFKILDKRFIDFNIPTQFLILLFFGIRATCVCPSVCVCVCARTEIMDDRINGDTEVSSISKGGDMGKSRVDYFFAVCGSVYSEELHFIRP